MIQNFSLSNQSTTCLLYVDKSVMFNICFINLFHVFFFEKSINIYESSNESSPSSLQMAQTKRQSTMHLRHSRPHLKQLQMQIIRTRMMIMAMTTPMIKALLDPLSVDASCNQDWRSKWGNRNIYEYARLFKITKDNFT